jgi:tRNA threonylcarbamoyladenosine biosynthesis protein TsaE
MMARILSSALFCLLSARSAFSTGRRTLPSFIEWARSPPSQACDCALLAVLFCHWSRADMTIFARSRWLAAREPKELKPRMNVVRTDDGLAIDLESEEETERLGQALAAVCESGTVIGLVGPLGAGKTRLVRAIAEALGVNPIAIASPTFVLIHEYEGRLPVYHLDVYRLTSLAEFEDLGPADYWSAGGVCLVEWADRVRALMPTDAWEIRIEPLGQTRRRAEVHLTDTRSAPEGQLAVLLIGSLRQPRS